MALTLGEFHDQVKAALKRGNTLDAFLVSYTERAARRIEKNHTYYYMEQFGEFTIDSTATQPRIIQLPAVEKLMKEVLMLRWLGNSGSEYTPIYQVDARRVKEKKIAAPSGYWRQGNGFLVLDNTPDVDYDFEIMWSQYTDWPTDTTASPWLVDNEVSLLMAETLLEFANFLRDHEMRADYEAQRDAAYHFSVESDLQIREANSDNTSGYTAFRGDR